MMIFQINISRTKEKSHESETGLLSLRQKRPAFSARPKTLGSPAAYRRGCLKPRNAAHMLAPTPSFLSSPYHALALEDEFGARLVHRKGSIPADIDLEL
jgi:hypothetical protein